MSGRRGIRVAQVSGVESESELSPMLDRLERVPGPRRDALAIAIGPVAGGEPNRFLIGVAVLSLLRGAGP